ncbi:hypothetical protein RYH73_16445 [Olivibacter sp. CPCC 100613]|uniref:hypothetical protein n=1 Tax=Olivibacter sp. CPCC 100613 TaxID=3079931 RepID=UPI002FF60A10
MKKTILRITLAAGLVGVANWAMNNDVEANASVLKVQEEEYRITDSSHPNFNLVGLESEISPLCQGTQQTCAEPTDQNSTAPNLEWNGNENKF